MKRLVADVLRPGQLTDDQIAVWRQFQRASPWLDSPFFAPEFTLATGKARTDTRVALLSEDGEIVGFFPFQLAPRGIGKPVGGPVSDYQGPILREGAYIDPEMLLEACRLRAYDFNHSPVELTCLATGGFMTSRSHRAVFRSGYEAYEKGARKTLKDEIRNLDRCVRKLEREVGPVVMRFDDRRSESWDWLVATKTRALAKDNIKAAFSVPWVSRLNDALRQTHTDAFAGLLSTVSCGDRIIAAHMGPRAGPVLAWWHTTYDEAFRPFSPGLILILFVIREGARNGLEVVDFGRGDQRYKTIFSTEFSALCEGAIARKASLAGVLRRAYKTISDASNRLPPGKYNDLPRRALGRLVSNVRLPRLGREG